MVKKKPIQALSIQTHLPFPSHPSETFHLPLSPHVTFCTEENGEASVLDDCWRELLAGREVCLISLHYCH